MSRLCAPSVRLACAGLAFLGIAAGTAAPAWADRMEPLPGALEGVDIDEKIGDQIPLGLTFRDSTGETVQLADMFDGERPVILTLNYSDCPMLCSLQLDGLIDAMRPLDWSAGDEFGLVTVSLDPTEEAQRAARTRSSYLEAYDRPAANWQFLTGTEANIRLLAESVGFGYRYDASTGEYHHAAAAILLTPSGTVARYLYGVTFTPETLRLGLVEAGEGKVGSLGDKVLLFCFKYDPRKGSYSMVAVQVMKLGGLLTLVALGSTLGLFWARERKRTRESS